MSAVDTPKPQGGLPKGSIVLDARNITKQFGGLTAVNDVTFTLPEKSIVSLWRRSGSGFGVGTVTGVLLKLTTGLPSLEPLTLAKWARAAMWRPRLARPRCLTSWQAGQRAMRRTRRCTRRVSS